MGIVGHLDVVPEGGDWSYDPYGGEIADGKLYGRGAIDDKGPVISAFYAMKAIKEAGIMPRKKVRLILGLDEETEWNGMRYYLKHTPYRSARVSDETPAANYGGNQLSASALARSKDRKSTRLNPVTS